MRSLFANIHADAYQHIMCGEGCGQLLAVTRTPAAVASSPRWIACSVQTNL